MLTYFGLKEDKTYKLFEEKDSNSNSVFGQGKVVEAIVNELVMFQEEGFNNKFILLVGPNGSAKTSIVKRLMRGAEKYSECDEGVLYTFSWIFPIENITKGTLGLKSYQNNDEISSFAYLEDKHISAIIHSELNDHPLLLIPTKYRRKLIDNLISDNPNYLKSVKKSYLYNSDLSKKNHVIYDALLQNYKGKHQDVLKHIRIERLHISKRYSIGASTIEPQLHIDARMQQITMDKRLASLPPSLQSLNLFSIQGELIFSNRGILEYSDLLKRPLDTFKYLLTTIENKHINLQGILTELDILFIGTSNEIHFNAFKQHPDFNSFKERFNFIRVPYLTNYKDEKKIYYEQISNIKYKSNFEPHALSTLCLFAVMTRLRPSQPKNYKSKKLSDVMTKINPLEKALILAKKDYPSNITVESKQLIDSHYKEIINEFENDNLYEGKFGLSPREIKKVIYKLARKYKNITFIEVIDYLDKKILNNESYDFNSIPPREDYHNTARFIDLIKEYQLNIFDKELRDSLGMIDDRSYEDYISKYINNINAYIKGEKIKNNITGKFEEYNQFFIKEFENNIELKENSDNFRSHLLSKLGAYSLDNPGQKIVYTQVLSDITKKLKEAFHNEQKKVIENIYENLIHYEKEKDHKDLKSLNNDIKKQIDTTLDNLKNQYGYGQSGAISLLKYLMKQRY